MDQETGPVCIECGTARPPPERPRGTCKHCGKTIEYIDPDTGMWLHTESRKVSCELYAIPLLPAAGG